MTDKTKMTRRLFGAQLLAGGLAAPSILSAQSVNDRAGTVLIRTNNYTVRYWDGYFSNLRNGAILVDTKLRALHFWSADGKTNRVFPVSVPLSPELTRLGRTSVVQKRVGPDWRPTPSMLQRNPDLPEYIGPGVENPLGTHAMYLGWQYYRIHGTNDTRKIGRQSSNGCIGLYNEDIATLFDMCTVGTQVLLI
ncbi:MAG TPA: L,D-transpeptidase [Paracoccaceae bacterium]|nr:L,D-transpeptidase [Paracoccaceae bacterium]